MRATEVQFYPIDAGVLSAADEVMPMLSGISHQRSNEGAIRPAIFDFFQFTKIRFGRAVADELDVVEADHARASQVKSGISGGHVRCWVADGFPNDAAPSRFEGPVGLVSGVRGWSGGKPEGIR